TKAQMLPSDLPARQKYATAMLSDVSDAAEQGGDAFSNGVTQTEEEIYIDSKAPINKRTRTIGDITSYRGTMARVFDKGIAIEKALPIAKQMRQVAISADMPSLIDTSFVVDAWQGITVDEKGREASMLLLGKYTNCFQGGSFRKVECITDNPTQWQIKMRKGDDGLWRISSRRGVDAVGASDLDTDGGLSMLMPLLQQSTTALSISSLLGIKDAAAYPSSFNKYGARDYALRWVANYNPNFQNFDQRGGDCTNFVSQAWNVGGGIPQDNRTWYHAHSRWFGWRVSGSFIRVKDFRSYWFDHGYQYIYVQGKDKLTSDYSPADIGDVYIFDSGTNPDAPSFSHASIAIGWSKGYDEYAQHSDGKVAKWTRYFMAQTPERQNNILRPGHGIRIIRAAPNTANPPQPPTPPRPSCEGPDGLPSGTKPKVNIFTTAIGRSGTDQTCPQIGKSYTRTNPQYVFCRQWGGKVTSPNKKQWNHWWLWTDLDTGGRGWISAYYIRGQNNDEANGIPNCLRDRF
ncbi:MAG: amidase domain-containing protein, partial [Methylococcaceae bacterium]|nr:amidase domain-containing protein [Methylococcaceae bacterium]